MAENDKPHGTRSRYVSGCRCQSCRAANRRYDVEHVRAMKEGRSNKLVDATAARVHIQKLSEQGIGRRAVSEAAGVSHSLLLMIKTGKRTQLRANTERKILSVDAKAALSVPAQPTWDKLNELIGMGYSKSQLARRLSPRGRELQMRHGMIRVSTANKVENLYNSIMAGTLLMEKRKPRKR